MPPFLEGVVCAAQEGTLAAQLRIISQMLSVARRVVKQAEAAKG